MADQDRKTTRRAGTAPEQEAAAGESSVSEKGEKLKKSIDEILGAG